MHQKYTLVTPKHLFNPFFQVLLPIMELRWIIGMNYMTIRKNEEVMNNSFFLGCN